MRNSVNLWIVFGFGKSCFCISLRVCSLVIRIMDNDGHNPTVERLWRTTREKKKNHIYSSQTWSFYLMAITCCLPGPHQMESLSLFTSNRISFLGFTLPPHSLCSKGQMHSRFCKRQQLPRPWHSWKILHLRFSGIFMIKVLVQTETVPSRKPVHSPPHNWCQNCNEVSYKFQ